jgi:hypothetical protein
LLERQRLIARLRTREQEVDHLVLENAGLDLRHHATVGAVELRRLGWLLVRRRELLHALLDPRGVEPDLFCRTSSWISRPTVTRRCASDEKRSRAGA